MPLVITEEMVANAASKLHVAAGPGGVDAVAMSTMLLQFRKELQALQQAVARLMEWLANASPPYGAYYAMMASHLVALDKQPDTRPINIGKIPHGLMAKCVLWTCGCQVMQVCGASNLCAGLPANIEEAVYAVAQFGLPPTMTAPPVMIAASDEDHHMVDPSEEATDLACVLMLNARNRFNKLSHKAAF